MATFKILTGYDSHGKIVEIREWEVNYLNPKTMEKDHTNLMLLSRSEFGRVCIRVESTTEQR